MARKSPVRHSVSGYARRDGTKIGKYRRGSGAKSTRKKRIVGRVEPQSKLKQKMLAIRDNGYMFVREWQLDGENTFGVPGYVQVSLGEYGRIGADEVVTGDLGDLFDRLLSWGTVKDVQFSGIDYTEWHPDEFEYVKLVRKAVPGITIKME